jgi:hypothetical protein
LKHRTYLKTALVTTPAVIRQPFGADAHRSRASGGLACSRSPERPASVFAFSRTLKA